MATAATGQTPVTRSAFSGFPPSVRNASTSSAGSAHPSRGSGSDSAVRPTSAAIQRANPAVSSVSLLHTSSSAKLASVAKPSHGAVNPTRTQQQAQTPFSEGLGHNIMQGVTYDAVQSMSSFRHPVSAGPYDAVGPEAASLESAGQARLASANLPVASGRSISNNYNDHLQIQPNFKQHDPLGIANFNTGAYGPVTAPSSSVSSQQPGSDVESSPHNLSPPSPLHFDQQLQHDPRFYSAAAGGYDVDTERKYRSDDRNPFLHQDDHVPRGGGGGSPMFFDTGDFDAEEPAAKHKRKASQSASALGLTDSVGMTGAGAGASGDAMLLGRSESAPHVQYGKLVNSGSMLSFGDSKAPLLRYGEDAHMLSSGMQFQDNNGTPVGAATSAGDPMSLSGGAYLNADPQALYGEVDHNPFPAAVPSPFDVLQSVGVGVPVTSAVNAMNGINVPGMHNILQYGAEPSQAPALGSQYQPQAAGDAKMQTNGPNFDRDVMIMSDSLDKQLHIAPAALEPPARIADTIARFNESHLDSVGYDLERSNKISPWLVGRGISGLPAKIPLCKPVALGHQVAFGTDIPDADNYVFCFSPSIMETDNRRDPIRMVMPVREPVKDVCWLSSTALAAATGNGSLRVFLVDDAKSTLTASHVFGAGTIHTAQTREIAANPLCDFQLASGGYDRQLCVTDLTVAHVIASRQVDDTIGSVKWGTVNRDLLSVTLDSGLLHIYDTRSGLDQPAVLLDVPKEELYTHEIYNHYNVLLGYGDGEIIHADLRQPTKILARFKDPYVAGVGGIVFDPHAHAFVSSGLTDFTVWKVTDGSASIWSHRSSGPEICDRNGTLACNATFLEDHATVFMTSNEGYIGIYVQKF